MGKIKKDTDFEFDTKIAYLLNHGCKAVPGSFVKNNLGISNLALFETTFDDLMKFVYMATNNFYFDGKEYSDGLVFIKLDVYNELDIEFLHKHIKATREEFYEINRNQIC